MVESNTASDLGIGVFPHDITRPGKYQGKPSNDFSARSSNTFYKLVPRNPLPEFLKTTQRPIDIRNRRTMTQGGRRQQIITQSYAFIVRHQPAYININMVEGVKGDRLPRRNFDRTMKCRRDHRQSIFGQRGQSRVHRSR